MRSFSRYRLPTPSHSMLQAVQAGYGLTQQQVATLVGASRAMLAMQGRDNRLVGSVRVLPLEAALRLVQLFQTLPAPYGRAPMLPVAPDLPLPAVERKTLGWRQRAIGPEEYTQQQQLERCQTQLTQARIRLQALPALRAALPDERAQSELDLWESEAHRMRETNAGRHALLALRLRVLAFEAAEIAKLLAEPAAE
ncbi:hypothetical protein SAMN02745146_3606 [Hymenobacter daecheongensis DSM 21074]|uniref:Uncharacterized protein n=1 Tax=Hymenobacter daecheongensis DSM 21074 TaxID=1121955 RepID=A0A1M6KXZ8_9BACT|nr:hypothetical protein [Hymenobacter daecheongensis]SHJ63817.1 hypothetical protein SAMN02745146_3606 [Hymenobacter daecheongensis DSM 21074]